MVRHRIAVHLSGMRHKNHQTVILRGKLRKQIQKIGKILRFRLPRRGGMFETVDRVEDEDAASPTQDKFTGFGKHPFRSGAAFEGDVTDVFGKKLFRTEQKSFRHAATVLKTASGQFLDQLAEMVDDRIILRTEKRDLPLMAHTEAQHQFVQPFRFSGPRYARNDNQPPTFVRTNLIHLLPARLRSGTEAVVEKSPQIVMQVGSGEDPFLGAMIAEAMVLGYQGKNMQRNDEIMACVKHFALYGAGEGGRDYNTVDMSRQRMFNEYMLPYEAAVEAGVGSVMASFNEVDGVPATANKWLMTDVLRGQWGFNGFVVTDYTGISEMIDHGIGDLQTVSARAINAGVDMDMVSEGFVSTLKKSIQEGKVSMETLNTACRRILEAKYKLGLFDNPYKYCDLKRPARDIFTKAHRDAARRIAAESFVLLKNDNVTLRPGTPAEPLLPFNPKGNIAVIGPLADSRTNMPGTWSVAAVLDRCPSLVEGLKEMTAGKANILYAKGSNLISDASYEERATMFGRSLNRDNRTDEQLLNEALTVANQSDIIIAALGESSEMSGESSSRTDLNIPDVQQNLLKELLKTGKPVVLVLFTGRPLTLTWEQEHVPAILNVWFGGSEAAYAIGDALFGYVNPGGKLTMSFPKNVGQIPLYYAHKNTGRPLAQGKWFEKFRSNYLDVDNEPLYPFGYGLSYTTFSYGDIDLSRSTIDMTGELTAAVMVTNTGTWPGSEVVQLYIRDLVGSTTRPVKELKGFQKIFLEPGQSEIVRFKIAPEMLRYYNYDLQLVAEPGEFEVMIGTNSRDVKSARFTLK